MTESSWMEIGRIIGAQGLKGELRVYPNSDFPERFEKPGQRWLLHPGETEPKTVHLVSGRLLEKKGIYVIRLRDIDYRDQAEALRDCRLVVPEGDRLPLEEDEYHILDLIGLSVYDQSSQVFLGTVVSVIPAGNDLLEVERVTSDSASSSPPQKTLIPFVKEIVPVVDLAQRRIEVTPPRGLMD
jgi:16S rRNA processing protein RimM